MPPGIFSPNMIDRETLSDPVPSRIGVTERESLFPAPRDENIQAFFIKRKFSFVLFF
jgi:hypothetical protein